MRVSRRQTRRSQNVGAQIISLPVCGSSGIVVGHGISWEEDWVQMCFVPKRNARQWCPTSVKHTGWDIRFLCGARLVGIPLGSKPCLVKDVALHLTKVRYEPVLFVTNCKG